MTKIILSFGGLLLTASVMFWPATGQAADKKKLVMIAGSVSHGAGEHEFKAGCLLLKKCLQDVPNLEVVVNLNGWPTDENIFNGADAVFIYSDGGGGHPAIKPERLGLLEDLTKKGVGLGCAHYAVEVPKDRGGSEFLGWIGGYFETFWSVNPHWTANFKELPAHPVTRGVKPFEIRDEWYYNMRFLPSMEGITPILTAIPPDSTRGKEGANSSHGGNPGVFARKGMTEHVMWAYQRSDGGRGFGFTGGHFHKNWGQDDFRKVVLNALLWIAKIDVPQNGVASSLTPEDLTANLDAKGGPKKPAAQPQASLQNDKAKFKNLVYTQAPAPGSVAASAKPSGNNASNRGTGPEAAKAYMATLETPPGIEATLFVCEPQFVNPADIDIDARGRVWVTEGANYRKWANPPTRPEGDRVVILEDTNNDGAADVAKTFYQDPSINSALGICVLGNRVIVSCGPHVFVLTDTDGDDKADKRELMFTGISGEQHDHSVHAFVFGPDGKLYFNFGNAGKQLRVPVGSRDCPLQGPIPKNETKLVVDLAGNEVADRGKPYREGMVFRCDLDGSNLETLGWNFRNNYEVAVDSFGSLWQSDNDDDGNRGVRINFVMEFGNYGFVDEMTGAAWRPAWLKAKAKGAPESDIASYHWHLYDPGVVPNLLHTGAGSPTGIMVYEADLLPKVFRNQIIHCDAGPRVVRAYPVEKSGAGYSATMSNLLTSTDSWYRPADVCVAPDGAVYIADWNDPGVGGHAMGDNSLSSMRGRIYRVAPPGHKASKPSLNLKTAAGCVAALQSPNMATRYLAWTELKSMGKSAESELTTLWKSADPRMRARAVQLLARIDGQSKRYIDEAIQDADPDIRIVGLRMARCLKQEVIPYVRTLAMDPSAQVRRECATALRHNQSSDAPVLWASLAAQHDGSDRWYLEALGIAADQQEDKFFTAWLDKVGEKWNTTAGRDIIWRSRSTKAPAYLVKIVTGKETKNRDHYMRAFDFIKGPEKEAALLELITVEN